jgi:hypothetical protein
MIGGLALAQTIVLLGTPFLGVSNTTLAIARRWLVPPKAVGDLDFLAAGTAALPGAEQVLGGPRQLRILLQHASLANYNRELINWKLDDEIYREYVLAPLIDGQRDGQLHWRRPLWEYFYPPVRKENDPEAAAEIVVRFLQERIKDASKGPLTIQEMWEQREADTNGLEALTVAAFRSVGIPARLNQDGTAELYAGGKWQPAPRPAVAGNR